MLPIPKSASTATSFLFCALVVGGCALSQTPDEPLGPTQLSDEELERARATPAHATAYFDTSEGRRYQGSITLQVNMEGPELIFMAHDETGHSLFGTIIPLDPEQSFRRNDDGGYSIDFSHDANSTEWLEGLVGTVHRVDTGDEVGMVVRALRLRVDHNGLLAATIIGAPLLTEGELTLGEDFTIIGSGRLTGSCLAQGSDNRILMDPQHLENSLCDAWLSGL